MQFKVPQNIDMEDKVIGPLTIKQFVYLLVAGMIFYATIKTYNIFLMAIVGFPVFLLALCLTFIKIQDQPFSKFLISFLIYLIKPRQRIWQKHYSSVGMHTPVVQKNKVNVDQKIGPKTVEKSELEKLSYILDTGGQEKAIEVQKLVDAPQIDLKKSQQKIIKNKLKT